MGKAGLHILTICSKVFKRQLLGPESSSCVESTLQGEPRRQFPGVPRCSQSVPRAKSLMPSELAVIIGDREIGGSQISKISKQEYRKDPKVVSGAI